MRNACKKHLKHVEYREKTNGLYFNENGSLCFPLNTEADIDKIMEHYECKSWRCSKKLKEVSKNGRGTSRA